MHPDLGPVSDEEKLRNFNLVVLRHLQSAFNVARWYVRNEEDAKDLTQEAMLRAFTAFDSFRGENGRSWLFTIIRNLHLNAVSRKKAETIVFDETVHLCGRTFENPEVIFCREADSLLLQKAIEKLSEELREVLILRVEGLSYKKIAGMMKLPLGTVMSRLYRAREHLRQDLAWALKGLNNKDQGIRTVIVKNQSFRKINLTRNDQPEVAEPQMKELQALHELRE